MRPRDQGTEEVAVSKTTNEAPAGRRRGYLQGIVSNTFKDGVGLNIGTPNSLAPTIPETVYSCSS